MAHSLTSTAPATTAIPISTRSRQTPPCFHRVLASKIGSDQATDINLVHRRSLALGLVGVVVGLNVGDKNANAARRPPPPPPQEKQDPSVSGLTAKVIASKKRKEAMKESIAKLREKGRSFKSHLNSL